MYYFSNESQELRVAADRNQLQTEYLKTEWFILALSVLKSPDVKKIHFIGIGGISMSGLAQILHKRGFCVTGSDINGSEITDSLQKEGIPVYIGHNADNIQGADLVVYTAAVDSSNPELEHARKLSIPSISRAALLGEIMSAHKYGIAVAGSHGKTSTTSMIAVIMLEAGRDPTIHIGGMIDVVGGSVKIGGSNYFVTEADEYCRSFLELSPFVAAILNIDYDHVDCYPDMKHVTDTFLEFARLVPEAGYVIGNGDDMEVVRLLEKLDSNTVTFGIDSPHCEYKATDISFDSNGRPSFSLLHHGKKIGALTLNTPGHHNIYNALAATAVCITAGCSMDEVRLGLKAFNGAGRRLEIKGIKNGIRVMDDYAHHPSEIKSSLAALRMLSISRTWCVFQPHTYSRTRALFDDFVQSFSDADTVIVTDIYAAREKDPGDIHSSILAEEINRRQAGKAVYISGFEEIAAFLKENASAGDIIITMGAGDVYMVGQLFLNCRRQPS